MPTSTVMSSRNNNPLQSRKTKSSPPPLPLLTLPCHSIVDLPLHLHLLWSDWTERTINNTIKWLSNRYKFNWDLISFGHELIRTTERLTGHQTGCGWTESFSSYIDFVLILCRSILWSIQFWVSWRSKSISLEHFDGSELSVDGLRVEIEEVLLAMIMVESWEEEEEEGGP